MQQHEDTNLHADSTARISSLEDNRKAYEAPTFKTLASSETKNGVAFNPDATSAS